MKKSKIYFIHQKSSGFERTVFNYFVHPNEVNSTSWSIGEPYSKIDRNFNDIWTSKLTKEQFIEKLNMTYHTKTSTEIAVKTSNQKVMNIFL